MHRIYINEQFDFKPNNGSADANKNNQIVVNDKDYHYLFRVLRQKTGQIISVFNGDGFEYIATINDINKKDAVITITDAVKNNNESNLYTTLIQAISKGERMDIAIAKAVELGVNEIYPVITEYNAVKLDADKQQQKLAHWQSIIISACEQCERAVIPKIHPIQSIANVIKIAKDSDSQLNLVLSPNTSISLSDIIPINCEYNKLTVLIGAEGGLSVAETELAIQHNFTEISLGKRILRTETATLAIMACLQMQLGDFK